MFNRTRFENTRPDGFGVLEVAPDGPHAPEMPRLFVPLKRTELSGEVAGPLADLCLTQTYGYSAEQCGKTLEAVYRFPLPGDAAVTGVTVRFGDVEIRAELKERERAEADYDEAKRQGRQAALATRESPDVFTLKVAGLQPDQAVVVETRYVQLARMEGSRWTLRIPLTTSPRYVRADEAGSRHAQGQPLALLRDPGHRFALNVLLRNAGQAASPTHALSVLPEEDGLRARLSDKEVLPDRDCVLTWQAAQEKQNPALHLLLHEDKASRQVYFLAMVAPPAERSAGQAVSREAVLLVDHSGSMEGAKWQAADWAVKRFLGDLTSRDQFALGLFHDRTHWFAKKPMGADTGTVQAAIQFLETNRDSGGTELGVALEQAVGQQKSGGEQSRHILIVTDAEVSDSGRILRLAEAESAKTDRRRISVLCIDAAPNSFLARELAERGGGIARFLTSQPEEEDISTALDMVLEDWAAPVLTGLRLEINRPNAQAVGREALKSGQSGVSLLDLGDLPAGRAVWIAGRVPQGEAHDLAFRVTTADGREVAACRRDLEKEDTSRTSLKALFGAWKVLGLEFLITAGYAEKELREQLTRMGYDAKEELKYKGTSSVYAENVRTDTQAALKHLLAREALDYGLASSETSFVAVRTEAGKPIDGTVEVANALPSGWSEGFVSPPGYAGYAAAPMQAAFLSMAMPASAPPPPNPMMKTRASYTPPSASADRDEAMLYESADAPEPPTAAGAPPPPTAAKSGGLGGFISGLLGGINTARSAASAPQSPSGARFESGRQTRKQSLFSDVLFIGVPEFTGGEAVLFDTTQTQDAAKLADSVVLSRLELKFLNGAAAADTLDPGLTLLIYVDDLASPRARVRLVDLMRQGGIRPLNLRRQNREIVRIVLEDAAGVWTQNTPEIEIILR